MISQTEIERIARLLWEARDNFCVREQGHNPWPWELVLDDGNGWLASKYRAMAKAVIKDRERHCA